MPAAIAIPLIIGAASAGASVYAAKKQSDAAKNAAQTQGAATDKALAAQREANQPYMQLGQQGVNRLMTTPQQAYTPRFSGAGGSDGYQAFQMPPQGPPPQANLASLGAPPQGPFNKWQGPMQGASQGQIGPQPGQMVRMQAPDGSIMPVPPDKVAQLEARGARRI